MTLAVKRRFSNFQIAVIIVAVILMFGLPAVPPPAGLSSAGFQVIGILIGALALWLFVAVDWPSMLVLFALMLVPVVTPGQVISGSLGNSTVFFLILCSMLSASLQKTGVTHRLALWFVTSKISRKSPWLAIGMIYIAIFILASFLSTTATMLVFIPIMTAIFETLGYEKAAQDKFPALMMTSIVVVSQIAQSTSPISHSMTLIGISTYSNYMPNDAIGFVQYIAICLPIGLVSLVFWYLLSKFVFRPDVSRFAKLDLEQLKGEHKPMSKAEKISGAIYLVTVLFWILPGVAEYIFPAGIAGFFAGIDQDFVPMIAIVLLHLIQVDGKPVMDYKDASKAAPWNTALFMGAILMVSSVLSNSELGITEWMASVTSPLFGGMSPLIFICVIAIVSTIATNFISNAINIAIFFAVAMPLLLTSFAGSINPQLVAILITATSNYSFATPTSTAPAAFIMDSGWVSGKQLFVWGMTIGLVGAVLSCVIGIPLGNLVLGG